MALIEEIYPSSTQQGIGDYTMSAHIEAKQTAADDGDGSDGINVSNHLHNNSRSCDGTMKAKCTIDCRKQEQAVEEGIRIKLLLRIMRDS